MRCCWQACCTSSAARWIRSCTTSCHVASDKRSSRRSAEHDVTETRSTPLTCSSCMRLPYAGHVAPSAARWRHRRIIIITTANISSSCSWAVCMCTTQPRRPYSSDWGGPMNWMTWHHYHSPQLDIWARHVSNFYVGRLEWFAQCRGSRYVNHI